MDTTLMSSIALEQLLELLDSKQFTVKEATKLVRDAQKQRSRLLQEVCDLNVRLGRYKRNHEVMLDAITELTNKNYTLRNTVLGLGGTV